MGEMRSGRGSKDRPIVSLNGRDYRILREIHQKPHTRVVLARHLALNRHVVIKLMSASNDLQVKSFQQELKALSVLQHPNNVTMLDAGVEQDADAGDRTLFLITERIKGRDLRLLLHEVSEIGAERAVHILRQALMGLAEAHELGLLHGDIKPENLMLSDHAHIEDHIKIIDYGLSHPIEDDTDRKRPGVIFGTLGYLPPEIIGGEAACEASDLYSLAVVLYECLAGRPPFEADEASDLMQKHLHDAPPLLHLGANVPRGLSSIIHKALEKRPEDRFSSASDFYDALSQIEFRKYSSATLERFPVNKEGEIPDYVGPRSAIGDQKPEVWVLTETPAIRQDVIRAVLNMGSVSTRILPAQTRASMLELLRHGRMKAPAAVVFSDLHAIAEDPLLVMLRDLGQSIRILVSTHLNAELLQNTLQFCGVDRIFVAPIEPAALQSGLIELIERQEVHSTPAPSSAALPVPHLMHEP